MLELVKDSAIKLFGKTISLPPDYLEEKHESPAAWISQDNKDVSRGDFFVTKQEDSISPKTPKKHELSESHVEEKTLNKKPDKIVPCPRCTSMETKFCYYNNYNVNQPRHFCKKCQRYWTSGGTMRNVPIGSGRRKNKNAQLPNYRHIMVSETINGMQFPFLNPNGILIFGSHNRPQNFIQNEFRPLKLRKEDFSEDKTRVLMPKSLRIDDPNEAAKSSIWSTLGIKNQKIESKNETSFFKSFQSKGDRNSNMDNTTFVLQANPAALSRSSNFHESAK